MKRIQLVHLPQDRWRHWCVQTLISSTHWHLAKSLIESIPKVHYLLSCFFFLPPSSLCLPDELRNSRAYHRTTLQSLRYSWELPSKIHNEKRILPWSNLFTSYQFPAPRFDTENNPLKPGETHTTLLFETFNRQLLSKRTTQHFRIALADATVEPRNSRNTLFVVWSSL